ncbi:RNA-binding protein [Leptospira yasudae]|uniref:RNA-binding protein n=1 Tax=Leptospira yasudae TaxID=2202201 RepID=A0A5F2AV24_9LEPT|nr:MULTISPECIES: RNA-binding protein [Leptospira]MBW0435734.1 RNA-binding protein [Leptospira yasudae]MCG6167749.1 RNA-binding protein [Leptospira sanjuanensis]MCG6193166.1 RNA-binding protein [Leptospira sanjuanensis]RHX79210.1 RNA-binding protein [Leptospira yasudae]RHX93305.1 RNA-binding protein [Leptospira yasudae]
MNIYIGNLAYQATEDDLRKAFESFGEVTSVRIITDKLSGKSRGLAFVEMANKDEGTAAIDGLNGTQIRGREIKVNEALPKKPFPEKSRSRY